MILDEKCGALICIMLACAMTSYGQQASKHEQISMSQKYPELDSVIHDIFGTNEKGDPKQQITTTKRGSKLNKQIENNNRNISLKDILQPNWESKNEPINKEYLEKGYKKSFGANTRTTEPNGSSKEAVESSDQFMKDLFGENWDQENKHVHQATPKEAVTNFGGSDSKSNGFTLNKEKNEDYDTFFRNVFGANWDNENKPINELFKNNIRINAGGSSGLGVDGSDKGLESSSQLYPSRRNWRYHG